VNVSALQNTDIVGGSYSVAFFGMVATTALLLLATGWVGRSWKLPVALAAVVTLVSAVDYFEAREVWLAVKQAPIIYQYAGWMITIPVQVLTLYFFVATVAAPSAALFWRLLVVAVFTVLVRYLGEAGFTHAALSFLIGIVGWLYILGECFFGQMNEIVSRSEDEVLQRGYFWLRLILTIGWAIYPLSDFITNFAGGADSSGRDLAFNLADFVNRIGFGLAILAVAMNAGEARTQTVRR
jgi:sensory rhodopsin